MIKIPYPENQIKKIAFETAYLHSFKKNINVKGIDKHLNKIEYQHKQLSFDRLITASFVDLIKILNLIETNFKGIKCIKKKSFNDLFDYKVNQSYISTFFMNQTEVDMSSCFYCNIDYINSFKDMSDYIDEIDFINSASIDELKIIKGLGDKIGAYIIEERKKKRIVKIGDLKVSTKLKNRITNFDFKNTHNHFTLDHVLPQSKYPYLSLSLYNLVPSCYSCNSKFKKNIRFSINDGLRYLIPTSVDFSLSDDFMFKIYYSKNLKKISSNSDFTLKQVIYNNEELIKEYFKMFKISGRFVYHKDKALDLIQLKVNYPDSKIKEISRLTGRSMISIKMDLFGKEIFQTPLSNKPFSKLKKDIATDIGII